MRANCRARSSDVHEFALPSRRAVQWHLPSPKEARLPSERQVTSPPLSVVDRTGLRGVANPIAMPDAFVQCIRIIIASAEAVGVAAVTGWVDASPQAVGKLHKYYFGCGIQSLNGKPVPVDRPTAHLRRREGHPGDPLRHGSRSAKVAHWSTLRSLLRRGHLGRHSVCRIRLFGLKSNLAKTLKPFASPTVIEKVSDSTGPFVNTSDILPERLIDGDRQVQALVRIRTRLLVDLGPRPTGYTYDYLPYGPMLLEA